MVGVLHLGMIICRFSSKTRALLSQNHNFAVVARGSRPGGGSSSTIPEDAQLSLTGWLRAYDYDEEAIYYFHTETHAVSNLDPDKCLYRFRAGCRRRSMTRHQQRAEKADVDAGEGGFETFEVDGLSTTAAAAVVTVDAVCAAIDHLGMGQVDCENFVEWWARHAEGGAEGAETSGELTNATSMFELLGAGTGGALDSDGLRVLLETLAESEWSEDIDPTSGKTFHVNPMTQSTQWHPPGAPEADAWVTRRVGRLLGAEMLSREPVPKAADMSIATGVDDSDIFANPLMGENQEVGVERDHNSGSAPSLSAAELFHTVLADGSGPITLAAFSSWWAAHAQPADEAATDLATVSGMFAAAGGELDQAEFEAAIEELGLASWHEVVDEESGRVYYVSAAGWSGRTTN